MTNQRIHIDNYEAFYLDYLEGELSAELVEEMEAFLLVHPELTLEDELLTVCPESTPASEEFKNDLKVFSPTETLSESSLERWIIAREERLLDHAQESALANFIQNSSEREALSKRYQRVHLMPDLNMIYPHKKNLKKGGRIIPLYMLSALAAASIILVFLLIPLNQKELPGTYQATGLAFQEASPVVDDGKFEPIGQKHSVTSPKALMAVSDIASHEFMTKPASTFNLEPPVQHHEMFDLLPRATKVTVHSSHSQQEATEPYSSPTYALSMKNPVEPITRRISDFIKAPVEIKTGEDQVNKGKGFYLRIGKFEMFRYKKQKDASQNMR